MNVYKKRAVAALVSMVLASANVTAVFAAQGVDVYRNSGPGSEAAAAALEEERRAEEEEQRQAEEDLQRKSITENAVSCLGARYVWGGESPVSGMDCSGLIRYAIRQALGIELPHSASAQSGLGRRISRDELKPGDLVFYSFGGSRIDHVALYLGDGWVVHASSKKHKIVISTLDMGTTSPDVYVSMVSD